MSVRLPDEDVAFYWPPPTSCRRGNVPNSKSASFAAILRAHPDPGPGTVNAAVGTVLHGLQVASPAPPRAGRSVRLGRLAYRRFLWTWRGHEVPVI